jgi:hypothetical protein
LSGELPIIRSADALVPAEGNMIGHAIASARPAPLYYAGYGVGWLAGSIAAGLLHETSLIALIALSIFIQLASLPVFLMARWQEHSSRSPAKATLVAEFAMVGRRRMSG